MYTKALVVSRSSYAIIEAICDPVCAKRGGRKKSGQHETQD
jgi:hypothetical protein